MYFRAGPLRTAAIVAAAFVATRVVYRIVFGGASGGGIVLLDLPRFPLGGPFAFVSLFGPITTGGLWNAAVSALPFAAVILAFGLINAVVDVQRLFMKGSVRGPLRSISRSLVIAWSTAPALAQAVRRMRRASALRGERSSGALLVPVFEQTIERALALAASMEVRGFAAQPRKPSRQRGADAPQGTVAAAHVTDAALGHDGAWLLSGVTLTLQPGTLTVLVGPTGSGKSSFLRALDGLFQYFDGGEQRGTITVCGIDRASTPPRDTAPFIGSVAQNVRLSFAASQVCDEIGFALSVQRLTGAQLASRVHATADALGIAALLDREVASLSTGEATLVAIAAAVIAEPRLLLIDEPLAELDQAARRTVCNALDRLAHEHGVAVLVAEHQHELWQPFADNWLQIADGEVHFSRSVPDFAVSPTAASRTDEWHPAEADSPVHPLADIRQLSIQHGENVVVHDASLALAAGEIVALSGANGAGKSSLLMSMALADAVGHVFVQGSDIAGQPPRLRRRHIALVPERVDDLFFQTSVAAECQRADRADRPGVSTAHTFAELLGRNFVFDIDDLLVLHPRDLSAGQQLCLAIAIQLAPSPAVLLVDEPSRGLDPTTRSLVGRALQRAAHINSAEAESGSGRAVLFATHDAHFARQFSTRELRLVDGQLGSAAHVDTGAAPTSEGSS